MGSSSEGGQFVGPPASPPEPAGRPLRRFGPRSLTSKLTVFVVSLVVVLVIVIGTGTYFALKSFLSDKLDQQLQAAVQGGDALFTTTPGSNVPAPLEVYVTALDPQSGRVVVNVPTNGTNLERIQLWPGQATSLARRGSVEPMTIDTRDGRQLRIVVKQGTVTDGDFRVRAAVVVGLSTADENQTLRRLLLLEVIIGSVAVLLAALATTAGVRFSLRRLRRVTSTAEGVALELSPEGAGLDRRVPDDEPDTEVGQLATSFNTMLSAVETQFAARIESEQRMRQFLADASHELRTPLTSIRGYAELARMQRAMGDTSEDNLDRIEFEGTRMSRLVEDLLLLARNEGAAEDDRPLERQLIDVADLATDAVIGVRAAFPQREILDPDVDPDVHVLGDPDQLLRVVRNLVTNAAVHTAPERPIRVTGSRDEHGVVIRVIDGGPGLPPDDAAHVFERFWRADKARTRARGGSGLGMSIVATIVRRHGGTVRFDSTVEGGSTVTVWLPAAQSM